MLLFLVLLTVTVACGGAALTLRLFGLITPAKVLVALTAGCVVLTLGSVALGEYRYRDCVRTVDRNCPNSECAGDYKGPFIPDCERDRVL